MQTIEIILMNSRKLLFAAKMKALPRTTFSVSFLVWGRGKVL